MQVWFVKVWVNENEYIHTHKIIADNIIKLNDKTIVADKVVIEFEENIDEIKPYEET